MTEFSIREYKKRFGPEGAVMVNADSNSRKLPSDNPIVKFNEDVLRRTSTVENFVQGVLNLDASRGAAVGVFGPWDSGKTSFINMVRQSF